MGRLGRSVPGVGSVNSKPTLRPYQVDAVEAARESFRKGHRSVLLVAPTASGKTVLASAIIDGAVSKGTRTLFLAHRRELIFQTRDKLRSFGVEPGIVMAGERMSPSAPCQVASVQTLAQRQGILQDIGLIFFDEAHHAAAATYQKASAAFPEARIIGLTATPWRMDGKGLSDVFEDSVLVSTPSRLRDLGYLCPVGGWAFEAIDTSGAKVQGGDFVASSMDGSSAKVLGSIVGEYVARANGKRAVCFCVSVAASQATAQRFRDAGVAAEHIDGETPKAERDAVLDRLRSGETKVVTNCAVLTEGFDLPSIEVCILARPTLSPSLFLQMAGRVLRIHPGKERAIIHDHARCLATHGHPYDERDYSMSEASAEKSVNVKRKQADESKPSLCRQCGAVTERGRKYPCAACGYTPSDADLAEELRVEAKEITEGQAKAIKDAETAQRALEFAAKAEYEKRAMFFRIVAKYGTETNRALGVYRWASGDTAWPKREWKLEAGFQVKSFPRR